LWEIDDDRWHTFFEKDVDLLIEKLFASDLVIGFNSKRFDYQVLKAYSNRDFSELKSLDLLEKIEKRLGFRLSLDTLSSANFSENKSANGFLAVKWFREGRLDLISEYCKRMLN